jgi:hypothetical protein
MMLDGLVPVAAIILIAGLSGGLCRTLHEAQGDSDLIKSLIPSRLLEGVIAAAVVPLFLSIIGNNDLEDALNSDDLFSTDYEIAVLKLLGFCLIAALSARRFLDTVSSRVMDLERDMKRVTAKVHLTEEKLTSLEDIAIEADPPEVREDPQAHSSQDILPATEREVLAAFLSTSAPARSAGGIALGIGSTAEQVNELLTILQTKGLVRSIDSTRGPRWVITPEGSGVIQASAT